MYQSFARVYDRLMDDVNYDEWFAHYLTLIRFAGIKLPSSAADVCCGTGQFAIRLAKRGVKVCGLDISPDMLNAARHNARESGLHTLPFILMDARKLTLPSPVEVIICACDGVNYLASPSRAREFFMRAHHFLKPGGVLVFDISAPYKFANILRSNTFGEDREDISYIWHNAYDPVSRLCRMELTLFFRQENGLYARNFETHTQRAHDTSEIKRWLTEAGFSDICTYSGMSLEKSRYDDERVHITAKKGGV